MILFFSFLNMFTEGRWCCFSFHLTHYHGGPSDVYILMLTIVYLWTDVYYPCFPEKYLIPGIWFTALCTICIHSKSEKSYGALLGMYKGLVPLQGFGYWGLTTDLFPASHKTDL